MKRYLRRKGYKIVSNENYLIKNLNPTPVSSIDPTVYSIASGLIISGVRYNEGITLIERPWSDVIGLLCVCKMLGSSSVGVKEISGDKLLCEVYLPQNIDPWKHLDPVGIGIWCMLSGAHYGTGFLLHVHENFHDNLKGDVASLNGKYHWDIKIGDDFVYVPLGSPVVRLSSPYIHEYYHRRVGVTEDLCGAWLKSQSWYNDVEAIRKSAVHPFIKRNPFKVSMYQSMDDAQRKKYLLAVFSQVRVRGFPYVYLSNGEREECFNLMKKASINVGDNNCLKFNNACNSLPNSFMNHRYKLRVKNELSPWEIFNNDKLLKKVLNAQLRINTGIRDTNIRWALSTYSTQALGQFNPLFAKFFCDLYCVPCGVVLDPCAGFGSRLCGCVSSGRTYIGIDPSTDTYRALREMIDWFESIRITKCSIFHGCGEDPKLYKDIEADMAITSPPYFDREEYSYEDTQSFKKYTDIESWIKGFLFPMIRNVYITLKSGCVFVLNVDNVGEYDMINPTLDILKRIGFLLEKTFYSDALTRPGTEKKSTEPYFILRKK
jgi:tRNA G10  N-methylase Trm11